LSGKVSLRFWKEPFWVKYSWLAWIIFFHHFESTISLSVRLQRFCWESHWQPYGVLCMW
jgi:hypothetical protein